MASWTGLFSKTAYSVSIHVVYTGAYCGRVLFNEARICSTVVTNLDLVGRTSSCRGRVRLLVNGAARIRYVDSP